MMPRLASHISQSPKVRSNTDDIDQSGNGRAFI